MNRMRVRNGESNTRSAAGGIPTRTNAASDAPQRAHARVVRERESRLRFQARNDD